MYTIYRIFEFQHCYSLQEYLSTYYKLEFQQNQCISDANLVLYADGVKGNRWERKNVTKNEISPQGVYKRSGDILAWEALQNQCGMHEAIPIVEKRVQKITLTHTSFYEKYQKILNRILGFLSTSLYSNPDVTNFLKHKEIQWEQLIDTLAVGSTSSYARIKDSLNTSKLTSQELDDILKNLNIYRSQNKTPYFPDKLGVQIPVYRQDGFFLGFHGCYVESRSKKYDFFNSGHLTHQLRKTIYGLHLSQVDDAIHQSKQVVCTEDMFDYFLLFQNRIYQVVSTLQSQMSSQQFTALTELKIDDLILGFSPPEERAVILGMKQKVLQRLNVEFIQPVAQMSDKSHLSLKKLLQSAITNLEVNKVAQRKSAIRQRNDNLETLSQYGSTFLIPKNEIIFRVKDRPLTKSDLKRFLSAQAQVNYQTLPRNVAYIRVPITFVEKHMSDMGVEIRTLLFLMAKTGRGNMVPFKMSTLRETLNLSDNQVRTHLRKLIKQRFLLRDRSIKGKGDNRTDHFNFYPSLIPYQ